MTQENHWRDTLWPTIAASGETRVDFPGTTSINLPSGTTAQRPASPQNGMMRYNITDTEIEVYNNGWAYLATIAGVTLSKLEDGDANTQVFVEGFAGADDNTIAVTIGDNSGTYIVPAAVLEWNTSGFDIETPAGNAGNSGVDFSIETGAGNIGADGGSLNLTSGDGGATGGGGPINIEGGDGGATSGAGGGAYITGGDAPIGTGGSILVQAGSSGTGSPSGNIFITGGETNGSNGGPILITGGDVASGVGIGGQVQIAPGTSLGADGAPISLTAGAGSGASNTGGAISITGGAGDASNGLGGAASVIGGLGGTGTGGGGAVNIIGGAPQLSGAGGDVNITAADALGIADGGDVILTSGVGAGGGSSGAVVIPTQTVPLVTTDKLYNDGGTLTWNGIDLTASGASASDLATSGADVNIDLSAPPTIGQYLIATSPTTATWQDAGAATDIATSGADVNVDAASPPTVGQTLVATSATTATWQTVAGAGDVVKVGTPVNNQIGVWTGDGTMEGDSDFTWDGTTLTVNGDIALNGNIAAELGFEIQTGTSYGPGAFTSAHSGKMVTMDNASPNTVTLPSNASLAYPIGTEIHFQQLGVGTTTIAIDTDTLNVNGNLLLALNGQYAVATALKMTATTWTLFGNLVPV
jgi:hypothetical protein